MPKLRCGEVRIVRNDEHDTRTRICEKGSGTQRFENWKQSIFNLSGFKTKLIPVLNYNPLDLFKSIEFKS